MDSPASRLHPSHALPHRNVKSAFGVAIGLLHHDQTLAAFALRRNREVVLVPTNSVGKSSSRPIITHARFVPSSAAELAANVLADIDGSR